MKSIYKVGMLVLLLVVPIFVYLLLKTFGKNHYHIPIYYPIEALSNPADGRVASDTIYHTIPGFRFKNQSNQDDSLKSMLGKIWIANFFFSRCPGICPQITNNLLRVQETFLNDTTVKMISFSVDPDYDNPSILKKYGAKFGITENKWTLCSSSPKDVYNLGFYGFKLPADTVDKTLHSEKVVLVDKESRIRGYYNGTEKLEIERLVGEIKVLEHEYELDNN